MGVLASVTGLFAGLALAKGLFRLFAAVGFTLPNSGIVFGTTTIVIALAAGIVVTLLASLRPAIRATRVPPIAAVREGATLPESRFARYRTLGSLALAALGFASLLWGLFGPNLGTKPILIYMGIGALLVFVGVAMLSVRVVGPLVVTVAPPIRWLLSVAWLFFLFVLPLGWLYLLYHRLRYRSWPTFFDRSSSAALARDNARRNPQRTASTAAALMIASCTRHTGFGARSGHHDELPERGQQHLAERGLCDHGAEQLHADPAHRGRGGGEEPDRRGGRQRADR